MDENSISSILNKHNVQPWAESLDGLSNDEIARYHSIEGKLKTIEANKSYFVGTYVIILLTIYFLVSFYHPLYNSLLVKFGYSLLYSIVPPVPLFLYVLIPEYLKQKVKKKITRI